MLLTLQHLFSPHYTNNNRARILHPAGLVVVMAVFLVFQAWTQLLTYAPALPGGLVLGYASTIDANQVIHQTNVQRSLNGLPPLLYDPVLSQAAQAKASHMFNQDYWAHIAPDGTTPWYFITNAGYDYSIAGENLARDFGDTDSMVDAWMESPTHKDNIVNEKYSNIGVAVVNGELEGVETTLVVQMFGTPAGGQALLSDAGIQDDDGSLPPQAMEEQPATTVISPDSNVLMQEPVADTALGTSLSTNQSLPLNRTLVSPLTLTKAVASSIVILMAAVLIYDEAIIRKKKIPRTASKSWAHLTLFGIVLMAIVAMTQGKIL